MGLRYRVKALRSLLSIPFRLVMLVAGALSVGFLFVGIGAAMVGDAFGGDHS